MRYKMIEFKSYNLQTAAQASKPSLEKAKAVFGFVPNLQRIMAESPALLEGYLTLMDVFSKSSLSAVEQQVVYLAANFENECHYCMAGHSMLAQYAGVSDEVIKALRDGTPIDEMRLEALRRFTSRVVAERGWVDESGIQNLLDAGYTNQTVLDVILGVAVKMMSNYTNHVAETHLDDTIKPLAWIHPNKRRGEK